MGPDPVNTDDSAPSSDDLVHMKEDPADDPVLDPSLNDPGASAGGDSANGESLANGIPLKKEQKPEAK